MSEGKGGAKGWYFYFHSKFRMIFFFYYYYFSYFSSPSNLSDLKRKKEIKREYKNDINIFFQYINIFFAPKNTTQPPQGRKVYYRKIEKHRQNLKYLLMVNQNAGAEEDYGHT